MSLSSIALMCARTNRLALAYWRESDSATLLVPLRAVFTAGVSDPVTTVAPPGVRDPVTTVAPQSAAQTLPRYESSGSGGAHLLRAFFAASRTTTQ